VCCVGAEGGVKRLSGASSFVRDYGRAWYNIRYRKRVPYLERLATVVGAIAYTPTVTTTYTVR
jgi:hypothetical protein